MRITYCFVLFSWAIAAFGEVDEKIHIVNRTPPLECDETLKARQDKYALVHFIAKIDESSKAGQPGTEMQNSKNVGLPVVVQLKEDDIIPGWILALDGACEGSSTEVIIPPGLGYGNDMTVRFEIDLLKVSVDPIEEPSMFDLLDENKDGQISLEEFTDHFKNHRKDELDPEGKPPVGLFMKDDVNQNTFLNWEEFSGPKGSHPPSVAAERVELEKQNPDLAKFKKGDPLEIRINPDFNSPDANDTEAAVGTNDEL